MITITEAAQSKINAIIAQEDDPNLKLRMYIQGGGCAGFNYGFTLDAEQNDDDFEFAIGSTKLIVDAMSMQYVQGSTVDYVESLMGANFSIKNPGAVTTCGCGSSFSI